MIFYLFLIWLNEVLALTQWGKCRNFSELFHLNYHQGLIQLVGEVNNDQGAGILLTHIFHNKPIFFTAQFLQDYLQFFDVRFLIQFISLTGVAGLLFGFWYVVRNKKTKYSLTLLTVLLLLPLVEIFFSPHLPFILRSIMLGISYQAFSLFGWYHILDRQQKKRRLFLLFLILLLSIWYLFVFYQQISDYCQV